MNAREIIKEVEDEPEFFRTRRGMQLLILQILLGEELLGEYWNRAKVWHKEKPIVNNRRRTSMGCMFRLLKDDGIINADQLRATELAGLKIAKYVNEGKTNLAEAEFEEWKQKDFEYGIWDSHMAGLIRDWRKSRKYRRRQRKQMVRANKNGRHTKKNYGKKKSKYYKILT